MEHIDIHDIENAIVEIKHKLPRMSNVELGSLANHLDAIEREVLTSKIQRQLATIEKAIEKPGGSRARSEDGKLLERVVEHR